MPAKSEIDKIIRGLELGEARYIRARLRGKKRQLFDFYHQQKKFVAIDLPTLFPSLDPKGLTTLRGHLEDRITQLLGEYYAQDAPLEKIRALQLKGLAYFNKALSKPAIRAFEQAYALSMENEEFPAALQVCGRMKIYGYENTAQSEKAQRMLSEIERAQTLMKEALKAKALLGRERTAAVTALLASFEHEATPGSAKAEIYYLRALIICKILLGEIKDAIKLLAVVKARFQNKAFWLHDALFAESVMALYFNDTDIQIAYEQDAKAAMLSLLALETMFSDARLATPPPLSERKLYIELEGIWLEGNRQAFDRFLSKIEAYLASTANGDPRRRVQLLALIAQRLTRMERYAQALDWTERVQTIRSSETSTQLLVVCAILELVCRYKEGDWEALFASCRRMEYLIKSRGVSEAYTKWIVKIFRLISKSPAQAREYLSVALSEITSYQESSFYNRINRGFNLYEWLEKETRGKSV